MKRKPAERNAIQGVADHAAREIARLEALLAKYKQGTPPYQRLESMLKDARANLHRARSDLSRTTLPIDRREFS